MPPFSDTPSMSLPEPSPPAGRQLYLWPADGPDMVEIASQLGYFGHQVILCERLETLLRPADATRPIGVLLDGNAAEKLSGSEKSALQAMATRVPIAALSNESDIATRLTAVRMGWHAFFTRPLDMTSLLDTLERITSPSQAEAGKVLIVDDSPSTAAFYAATLDEAGFLCHVVTEPLKTLEALDDIAPELILLDMHMPGASGEELAKVIRQQDAYLSTPIVFLSAESDVTRQREAMSLGGDEFLQKPIAPQHLISAVKSRVIRYRALRALMVRDSLTGLLNHTSFKERLRAEVARSKRQDKPLSVGLIDIDFFKQVNDSYGHPAGDRVIKNLARLLKQRLRNVDVIGRYGGEEFAVALADTASADAHRVLDHIRTSFEAIVQFADEQTFRATLSAGVAQCPPGCDAEDLIRRADVALYAAKRGGRNRVEMATTGQEQGGEGGI